MNNLTKTIMPIIIIAVAVAVVWAVFGLLWGYKLAGGFDRAPLTRCYAPPGIAELKVPFRGTYGSEMDSLIELRGTRK